MQAVSVDAVVNGEETAFEFMGKCVPMHPMRESWVVQSKIFTKEVLNKDMPHFWSGAV